MRNASAPITQAQSVKEVAEALTDSATLAPVESPESAPRGEAGSSAIPQTQDQAPVTVAEVDAARDELEAARPGIYPVLRAEAARQEYTRGQRAELLRDIPDWGDPATMVREVQNMVEWAKQQGFTGEQIQQVGDARTVKMWRKAYLSDQAPDSPPRTAARTADARVRRERGLASAFEDHERQRDTRSARRLIEKLID